MAAKKNYSGLYLVLAFALAAGAYYLRETDAPQTSEQVESKVEESLVQDGGIEGVGFTIPRIVSKEFEVLEQCVLREHRNNDGDSFYVRHGREVTQFRLYFVDAPESQFKTYPDGNDNGKRISEQGRYFGGLGREETTGAGMAAKKFTLKLLEAEPFTVVTRGERVFSSERLYAFVIVKWEGREVYLHELLVAQGLVRIHTKPHTLPDNTAASRQRTRLQEMEVKVKAARRGAWGL